MEHILTYLLSSHYYFVAKTKKKPPENYGLMNTDLFQRKNMHIFYNYAIPFSLCFIQTSLQPVINKQARNISFLSRKFSLLNDYNDKLLSNWQCIQSLNGGTDSELLHFSFHYHIYLTFFNTCYSDNFRSFAMS